MPYYFYQNKDFESIAKKEKVSSLVAKAIEAFNLSNCKNIKLDSPYKYKGMQEIVNYLLKSINEKKKIMVYGDYDVDGICSIAILKRLFSLLNTNIGYYIPNRYLDGYGINEGKVNEIAIKGYDILICIDNGINAVSPIKLAKEKGMDVIVLDHHELNSQLPECDYLLHPIISNFSSYNMCASSIAYHLSRALLGEEDEKCAILAGLATLSDIMPLIEQNKVLLKDALLLLNEHKFKNLDLLIDDSEYNESVLSMTLIPKLNSIGRIIKDVRVNSVINFLFETEEKKLLEYSKFILGCNESRKNMSNEFFNKIDKKEFNNVIIVKDDTLLEGVCGIVASRLSNHYNLPAFVFAKSEDGNYYKGSARSIEGINLVDLLNRLNYLVSYGGHEKAAGITINKDDFNKFKKDLENMFLDYKKQEILKKAVLIEENELTYKNYLELLKYGPFGEGNPYPVFGIKNIDANLISFSKDRKHLIIKLNNEVTLLGFNLANKYQEKYNKYEVIFTIDKNNLIKNKLSCKCIEINGGK